jgi:precorrin-3B C17-methyltransferase
MGKIFVVGIGPGSVGDMTLKANVAIESSTVIVGYTKYIELIEGKISGKRAISTGMTKEVERCDEAVRLAAAGETVTVVSSGDPGVYGMAGLILERLEVFNKQKLVCGSKGEKSPKHKHTHDEQREHGNHDEQGVYEEHDEHGEIEVEIVPGITAALSGAAVLGAPLANDFCTISLSDLLTPQEVIDKRAEAAGIGDFCCVVYNPMSGSRKDKLRRLCEILMKYKGSGTVCGYVRNIGRADETKRILSLCELRDAEVDMFTTIFIGNASTRVVNGRIVTSRGYENKLSRKG